MTIKSVTQKTDYYFEDHSSKTNYDSEEEYQKLPSEEEYKLELGFELNKNLSNERIYFFINPEKEKNKDSSSREGKIEVTNSDTNVEHISSGKIASIKRKVEKPDSFLLLQKWEGIVIEKKEEYFKAKLIDLTQESNLNEYVEIYLDEVSPDDLPLIEPGAIFYWSIGYFNSKSGQRKRESIFRFRRLPAWGAKDIENAEKKADVIRELMNLEHDKTSAK